MTSHKITLTIDEEDFLAEIRSAGSFRSDSQTIGECLRLINTLSKDENPFLVLKTLGKRFGITVKECHAT
jgi:hypothetical protein